MEPGAADANSEKVAHVLQTVVRHVTDIKSVAHMCQLSQACRRAMQQSTGCLNVKLSVSAARLQAVTGFAAWLPKYPGLVRELEMNTSEPGPSSSDALAAAEQLVVQALQLCAERSSRPMLAKPALQLRSFKTNFLFNEVALDSLATCRDLAQLRLDGVPEERLTSAVCGALAGLTSLTQLQCSLAGIGTISLLEELGTIPHCFSSVLARLPQLQVLKIAGKVPLAGVAQLPSSLTGLGFVVGDTEGSTLTLSHLSRLQTLSLGVTRFSPIQVQLPEGLSKLQVQAAIAGVRGAQQLQDLLLFQACFGLPLLGRLCALPRLCNLHVGLHGCSTQQMEEVATAIEAATQLTALHLFSEEYTPEESLHDDNLFDCSAVRLHPHLCKLRSLQDLRLLDLKLGADDLLHLTGVTSLTHLQVYKCSLDDLSLAAMLQRQSGLRELVVVKTRLSSPILWVVLGMLTSLQSLLWRGNGLNLTCDALELLAPLTALSRLEADRVLGVGAVSTAAEQEYVSRIPQLNGITWC